MATGQSPKRVRQSRVGSCAHYLQVRAARALLEGALNSRAASARGSVPINPLISVKLGRRFGRPFAVLRRAQREIRVSGTLA